MAKNHTSCVCKGSLQQLDAQRLLVRPLGAIYAFPSVLTAVRGKQDSDGPHGDNDQRFGKQTSHLVTKSTKMTRCTVIIQIERQIQSSGRNSIFAIFVNAIMRVVVAVIIFE